MKPMMAKPIPKNFDPGRVPVRAEPKYDGHRHLVLVSRDYEVTAWSSRSIDATHKMDDELRGQLSRWKPGIYDGELHLGDGTTSSDVAKLANRSRLIYTAFDVLLLGGEPVIHLPWTERRNMLRVAALVKERANMSPAWSCNSREHIDQMARDAWDVGNEGIMLKVMNAPYEPGKRRAHYMKVKAVETAVLLICGYDPPTTPTEFGTVRLRSPEGVETAVKVKNRALRAFCLEQGEAGLIDRALRIEYQMKTPDGNYRHPRWDHLLEED